MTPELWQRLKPLYNAALDLSTDERSRFVQERCGDDAECAAELNALLAAEANSTEEFASPVASLSHLLTPPRWRILAPGTLLAGRFRIVRHLGSGGMGDVYEALDEQMEQGRIALKTIRPEIAENAAALARFKDEVRLARKVSGPNVCRIHELYLTGTKGSPCSAFLTMELLEGVTLHERIAQASPLSLTCLRQIASQLCTALSCIHEAGIIHQDLKPRNVMLMPHGDSERVVVMDFGLARAAVPFPGHSQNGDSSRALVAGTPSYMAPEQFEGREVGPATDIYALGLILYEMATAIQPYAANTPLAAAIRRSKPPTHASAVRTDLPGAWDEVIARCLQYEPEQRFGSAQELSAALFNRSRVVLKLGQDLRLGIPQNALIAAGVLSLLFLAGVLWLNFGRTPHRELTPDTARWYTMGMAALREGSYLKATRLLARVTERDPTYALAHAALADAWTELDFTESAQHEMLLASAPDEQRGLNEVERRYIDAVRTTLVRDYSAAAQDYEAILTKLPADSKAQGYVDLGRIYEKAGRIRETLTSYEKAAELNPDDPAPFLHLGILKSRLRDPEGASRAFSQAETLYTAESDPEGLAEVAYQRGYAADDAGLFDQAKQYLERSLEIAHQVPDIQMEVRSLSQLSSLEDNRNNEEQALLYANEASARARAAGLEYWVTDSLIRAGNAYMGKENFPAADTALQEALQRAQQNSHPRLTAFAELNLASLSDQQARSDEQIHHATSALRYYQDYGFLDSADQALLLLGRGQLVQANYADALVAAKKLVQSATRTHSSRFVLMGEELLGDTLLQSERYPDALGHFETALRLAEPTSLMAGYEQTHCAEAFWHLGRFDEAGAMIASVSPEARKRSDLGAAMVTVQAEMQRSRGDFNAVLASVAASRTQSEALVFDGSDLQRLEIEGELGEKKLEQADQELQRFTIAVHDHHDFRGIAQADALRARLDLASNSFEAAERDAEAAENFFQAKGMRESQALSLLVQARIARAQRDGSAVVVKSRKGLDLMQAVEQSWGVPIFQIYSSRPDLSQALRELRHFAEADGASQNGK